MSNILVVDDSGLIRLKVRNILESEEYKVFEAHNFSQLKLTGFSANISLRDIDLIILDVYLGQEDGLEILEYLTNNYKNIPVIMISVEGRADIVAKAFNLGAQDYILKPFDKKKLLSRITNILNSNQKKHEKLVIEKDKKEYNINNINSFKINLSLEINRSLRSKNPFSIIKVKMSSRDNQQLVSSLKEVLTLEIRDIDQVYIMAETEFMLFLPLTEKTGAQVVLARLQDKVTNSLDVKIISFPEMVSKEVKFAEKKRYYIQILEEFNLCE